MPLAARSDPQEIGNDKTCVASVLGVLGSDTIALYADWMNHSRTSFFTLFLTITHQVFI